jgi:hypothetical protein
MQVHRKRYDELESWVQCDACGKWRSIARCLLREVPYGCHHAKNSCMSRAKMVVARAGFEDILHRWRDRRRGHARSCVRARPANQALETGQARCGEVQPRSG